MEMNGNKHDILMASFDPSKDNERRETCEFLIHWGRELQLPQLTISTAIILFHRFYTKYTFEQFDRKCIAVTCLFLAGKIQETPKKLRDIITITYNVEAETTEHNILRDDILRHERILLQSVSFEFSIELPYQEVVRRAKKMLHHISIADDLQRQLHQFSWNFVNDSLKTTVCLQYEPKIIACASIYMAMQYMEIQLPPNWLSILEANLEDLNNIRDQILDVYGNTLSEKMLSNLRRNPRILSSEKN